MVRTGTHSSSLLSDQENVQELTVICNSDEISATLPNAELPPCICLSKLRLWAVCLQEGSLEPMVGIHMHRIMCLLLLIHTDHAQVF